MAEETTPPPAASGGNPTVKAERWARKHKVVVGAAAIGAGFLLLSRRGQGGVIQGPAVAATDERSGGVSTGDDAPVDEDPALPVLPDPEPAAPVPDVPPPVEPLPPAPVPEITAPPATTTPIPPTITPSPAPGPTLSTVPSQTSKSIQQEVKYETVPGYYSEIQAYDSKSGLAYAWHHYTSGTRKGDKVRVNALGNYGKGINPTKLAGQGWSRGTLGMGEYERYVKSVQYESTQVARVTTP